MAKNKAETTALEKPTSMAVETVPDYIQGSLTAGKEDIRTEDLIIPRLAVAQALSPQVIEGEEAFIEGLRPGELFNTLTSDSYGRGPVKVIIVKRNKPIFHLIEGEGKDRAITERNLDPQDPRCQWDGDTPPLATEFREFFAVHAETGEPLGLSFKSTSIKAAKELDTFITLAKNVPLWGRVYAVTTLQRKNDKGVFFVFKVRPAGYPTEDAFKVAASTAEAWQNQSVKVDDKESAAAEDDMATPEDGDGKAPF